MSPASLLLHHNEHHVSTDFGRHVKNSGPVNGAVDKNTHGPVIFLVPTRGGCGGTSPPNVVQLPSMYSVRCEAALLRYTKYTSFFYEESFVCLRVSSCFARDLC